MINHVKFSKTYGKSDTKFLHFSQSKKETFRLTNSKIRNVLFNNQKIPFLDWYRSFM